MKFRVKGFLFTSAVIIPLVVLASICSAQTVFSEHTLNSGYRGLCDSYAADLDSDGDIDILAASNIEDRLDWWENDGNNHFTSHWLAVNYNGASAIFAIDLDEDGDTDALGTSHYGNDVTWFENNGAQSFTPHIIRSNLNGANDIFVIDLDSDGDLDVLTTAYNADDVTWFENDGNENFTEHTIKGNFNGANCIYAIDIEPDGDIDVLASAYNADDITWWENNGNEVFTEHTIKGNYDGASSVFAMDMDGDGDVDVLGTAEKADDVTWWENDGNENFSEHTIQGSFKGANDIHAADMDNDGDIDVVASGADFWWIFTLNSDIAWWENDGNQSFTGHTVRNIYFGANSVHVADIDQDEFMDIIGTAYHFWFGFLSYKRLAWWENLAIVTEGMGISVPRDRYFMVGIPVEVNDGDAGVLFQDDFGGFEPGPTTWRVSRWDSDNQTYLRYNEENSPNPEPVGNPPDFAPGLGFWIVQDVVVDAIMFIDVLQFIGDGLVPQDERYGVTLQRPQNDNRGITQLANPFIHTYDWSTTYFTDGVQTKSIEDAADDGWVSGSAAVWDEFNNEYNMVSFAAGQPHDIDPWDGFWLEQLDDTRTIDILFTPVGFDGVTMSSGPQIELVNGVNWSLQLPVIMLDSSDVIIRDFYNLIGVNEVSDDEYDLLDAMDYSPQSSEYVRLFFPHPDWDPEAEHYTYDIRSLEFDGPKTWDFTIRILNLPSQEFALFWPNISEVSIEYSIVLEDVETGNELADLRADSAYTFYSDENDMQELFYRLVVTYTPDLVNSDTDPMPASFSLDTVYPNPFNQATYATVSLPNPAELKVAVYNILGELVEVIADGSYSQGRHRIRFDADNLSSGIYFIRASIPNNMNAVKKVVLVK